MPRAQQKAKEAAHQPDSIARLDQSLTVLFVLPRAKIDKAEARRIAVTRSAKPKETGATHGRVP